jgi:predicted DNA-binding transcriptional regulator YafY
VYDGLLLERQIDITYCNRSSEEAQEGRIHSLGLVFVDNITYLVCTFWDYEDIRQIALHRIKSAQLLEDSSERPDGFDLQGYIDKGSFGFPQSEDTIQLKCLFDSSVARHLEESPINGSQKLIPQGDGQTLLEAEVHDTSQLQWWVLGFGDQVEVVAPESLRVKIAKTCQQMTNIYSR